MSDKLKAERLSQVRIMMKFWHKSTFLIAFLLTIACGTVRAIIQDETTLHLLTLLPPGNVADSLLPAAELAVDKINAKDDLLPGYRLELIAADTEKCNETLITESYISFAKYSAPNGPFNVVGVTGLTCATVTQVISPLAGHPEIDLLQISAGTAPPTFTNMHNYPRLYRMVSSSAVQNDAVLALMNEFQWKRISIISDSTLIDHTGTAHDFITKVIQDPRLELVSQEIVTPRSVFPAFTRTISNAAKIIYVSMTAEEACQLLYAAYEQGRIWPTYVWIFRNLRVEDFRMCNNDSTAILEALENVFLINYKLETSSPNAPLVSGDTYEEYRQEYQRLLVNGPTAENAYANALHDSVWAYALALNNSLGTLTSQDLKHYGLGKSNVTSIIESNLKTLNFLGALGHVYFTDKRETETTVDILQVNSSGNAVRMGYYDPHSPNFTLQFPVEKIPDDFETVRLKLNPVAPIITLVIAGTTITTNTVVLLLYISYWNKPTVKASSPKLGILILVGCYFLSGAAVTLGLREYIDEFGKMCQAELWLQAMGYQLIYGTLLMRLLRVYRIFVHTFSLPGKFWFDWPLVITAVTTVLGIAFFHLLWTTVAPFATMVEEFADPPFIHRILVCDCPNYLVWSSIHLVYLWTTFLLVVIFAILTRGVKIEKFRDTVEVNLFVLLSFLTLVVCFAYSYTLIQVLIIEGAFTFELLPYLITPLLCQLILFAPKLWVAKSEKRVYLAHKHVVKSRYTVPRQVSRTSFSTV